MRGGLKNTGRLMIQRCRSGVAAARSADAAQALSDAGAGALVDMPTSVAPAVPMATEELLRTVSADSAEFERAQVLDLQKVDPNFRDIVLALELKANMTADGAGAPDETTWFKALKRQIVCEQRGQAKRAGQALRESRDYILDGLLSRKVIDPEDNAFSTRVVVPAGGIRSFHYNGWRCRLPLRKAILLMYHDAATFGGIRESATPLRT